MNTTIHCPYCGWDDDVHLEAAPPADATVVECPNCETVGPRDAFTPGPRRPAGETEQVWVLWDHPPDASYRTTIGVFSDAGLATAALNRHREDAPEVVAGIVDLPVQDRVSVTDTVYIVHRGTARRGLTEHVGAFSGQGAAMDCLKELRSRDDWDDDSIAAMRCWPVRYPQTGRQQDSPDPTARP
jgi:hypothetical protein